MAEPAARDASGPFRVVDTIEQPDGGLTVITEASDGTILALNLGPRQSAGNDGPHPKGGST